MIKEGKIAGRAVLLAGQPGTGAPIDSRQHSRLQHAARLSVQHSGVAHGSAAPLSASHE
jgi:hypothetical protein